MSRPSVSQVISERESLSTQIIPFLCPQVLYFCVSHKWLWPSLIKYLFHQSYRTLVPQPEVLCVSWGIGRYLEHELNLEYFFGRHMLLLMAHTHWKHKRSKHCKPTVEERGYKVMFLVDIKSSFWNCGLMFLPQLLLMGSRE